MEGVDFTELATLVWRLTDRQNLSILQKNNLWRAACEIVLDNTRLRSAAEVKRTVCQWL